MKKVREFLTVFMAVIMCSACAVEGAEVTTTSLKDVITYETAITEPDNTTAEDVHEETVKYEIVDGTVMFPEDIIEIPGGLLFDCKEPTRIIVPDGVEIIGVMAFWGCENVTEIYLPDSIRIIDQAAFPSSEKLNIIYKGKTYSYKDKVLFYNTFWEYDSIAPPEGMTTDDLCDILYYNGKQLQLPLTADDFLALNENWVFDGDAEEYAALIHDVDENGNWIKSMLICACSEGSIHSHEDVNRKFIMSGFELGGFSLNGDIEIGDDYSELKAAFGEPSGAYPNSEEERDINGYDEYWFRDKKRVFKLGVDYADGKIADISIVILGLIQDKI